MGFWSLVRDVTTEVAKEINQDPMIREWEGLDSDQEMCDSVRRYVHTGSRKEIEMTRRGFLTRLKDEQDSAAIGHVLRIHEVFSFELAQRFAGRGS